MKGYLAQAIRRVRGRTTGHKKRMKEDKMKKTYYMKKSNKK